MKEITVLGRNFFYEVFYDCDEWGDCYETYFYTELGTKARKKYWLFGPMINVPDHTVAFKVYFNVESHDYTKDEMRDILEHEVELMDRPEQIRQGIII